MTLSEHLYGFSDKEDMSEDMAEFAAMLRRSGLCLAAAKRCLALVPWCVSCDGGSVERQLQPLRSFLESAYQRVSTDWVLAKLSECEVGETVLFRSWECRVEASDGRRHLRCDGLRFADVTEDTEVARRKPREVES